MAHVDLKTMDYFKNMNYSTYIDSLTNVINRENIINYTKELIANGKPVVESAAIIGGGGSRDWRVAKEAGFDIYISGDTPHHVRRDIILNNYNYLDMPHEIEKIFIPQMKKILLELDDSLEILTIDHEKLPKVIC